MKRLFVTVCIALGFISFNNAQSINFGVTAGYANVSNRVDAGGGISASEDISGFYAGILLDIGVINKLHIQPEVLYVNAEDTNLLYVPILVKYYVVPKFNLQAGPQANFVLDETFDDFNTFGLDLTFGAGFDITKKLFVEARYSFEITNRVDQAIALGGALVDDVTSRFNSFTIGIGYKF